MQATGSSSSAWGGRRAAAGHPSPYTLQAFAIGNEDCRVKGYAPNFVTIAKAVRAAYPKLPLILGCEEQECSAGWPVWNVRSALHEDSAACARLVASTAPEARAHRAAPPPQQHVPRIRLHRGPNSWLHAEDYRGVRR